MHVFVLHYVNGLHPTPFYVMSFKTFGTVRSELKNVLGSVRSAETVETYLGLCCTMRVTGGAEPLL